MPTDFKIFADRLAALNRAVQEGDFTDALYAAVNEGNGMMQQRIFKDNLDTEGNSFGLYVGQGRVARLVKRTNRTAQKRAKAIVGLSLTPYQRKRALLGRQINHKDLELFGSLRRSIKTVIKDQDTITVEFENDTEAAIGRGQENQITNIRNGQPGTTVGNGIKIFTFDKEEQGHVINRLAESIVKILNQK